MRQRPVVVIAVSLLLIAGATGFQLRGQILHLLVADRPISGSPPLAIGHSWDCSGGWLKTYQPSMLYYPSYHPASPNLDTMPSRCYRTEAEAKSAGYKLAPPPNGGAVLDGVYLVPASNQVRTMCRAAAVQLGAAIPCPTLLPLEVADSLCSPVSRCTDDTDGGAFAALITLTTPPDFPGARAAAGFSDRGEIQLELWAAPLANRSGQRVNQCPRSNSGPTVMGRPTLWATCIGPSGESTSWLTWEVDDWIYDLGMHPPQTSAIPRMIQFFASKLVAVSPTGG
jgi:hypothetical protein